jgi:predicted RND superfamily exporter protein
VKLKEFAVFTLAVTGVVGVFASLFDLFRGQLGALLSLLVFIAITWIFGRMYVRNVMGEQAGLSAKERESSP